ncbi:uncharacterized protein [Spinacia oleracea]|uniref:Uncharacterized protein isoform X2 n=1 Tax=Spinacia oleracea TaxID=3562 RepID=A0A9R0JJV3_SPIOL|nr:uncharacterized protein LOC110776764 isoform X2 [Spinacia oleracea]
MGVGRGGNNNVNQVVPTSSKKMIQSLKEIVNCPEAEIYAMLKECNMDPNEAVNRLLSQDPFHEVKSKREKKKETKDVGDSRARGTSSTSTRGGKGGSDRYSSRSSMAQYGTSDYGASRGKSTYKKENEPNPYISSAVGMAGHNVNRRQPPINDATMDKQFSYNAVETSVVAPPSSGFQSAWSGMPGQVSMADVVKMGRPQGKVSSTFNTSQHVNNQHHLESPAVCAPRDLHPSQNYAAKVLEGNQDSGASGHLPPNDDWPLEEDPPAASVSAVMEPSVDSEQYGDPYDRTNQQFRPQSDEVRFEEDDIVDNANSSFARSMPGSNQNIQEDNSGSASGFDNDLYQNISSYQVHHQEVEDTSASVSTVTNNFQTLSLPEEDTPSEEDGPAVKIPDHLQVQSAECSHLSFGSFGTGVNAPFSGSFGSRAMASNEEESALSADDPSTVHSEARNPEYYEDEHLRTASDVHTSHRMGGSSGNFDAPSASQQDMLKQEAPEIAQANQYSFPSSTANYGFDNSQQLNSYANLQTSSQMQGMPSLSGVMPYSNSLPNTLLASNVQPPREAEFAYSPFPISQSMASKYGNSVSSNGGPTASMAEALKAGNFSAAQTSQTLPGGNSISGGAALPQHLAMHPYSQPSLPMGHFTAANMMGYPLLPQSYTYMPSAFHQAFAAGNNAYPQSLAAAAVPPQYKNSVSGTSMNYEDLLRTQYKDASHLLSLQQGAGSRTLSGVPGSTYYNSFEGQNQQPSGFRQNQQPSQHYGPLSGYPNFYHSSGLSLDHQQQMSRDGSLSGSQGQPPKQNQQIWQNGY